MVIAFLLVFILAIIIGIIVHFALVWYWPTPCGICETKNQSTDIWKALEGGDTENNIPLIDEQDDDLLSD